MRESVSLNITTRFARGAEITEVNDFSIAVDLPSLKLWQGKEDGDGKPLSPRTLCGDGKSKGK